jgi:hypothetical protein
MAASGVSKLNATRQQWAKSSHLEVPAELDKA